jgi:hypothetical protein
MKIEVVKRYVEDNKDKLPLSYNDLVFKLLNKNETDGKITSSVKYNDTDYTVCGFYKSISRF